jgi:hypothetical protein
MAAVDQQPISVNLQQAQGFSFNLKRAPSLSYWCNNVKIPSIRLPQIRTPSPSLSIPNIGDHIEYGPFMVEFQVDDELQNWLEIFNWMDGIANPQNKKKIFEKLEDAPPLSPYGEKSDLSVFQYDAMRNPHLIYTFERAWPTELSGVVFQSTDTNVQYLKASVTFLYTKYSISRP